MTLEFKRAKREQVPLKLGISGPSGSGKTTGALRIARGLVGPDAPIALLDTENGSASLYADLTEFDVLNMNPPYQVAKFTAAIELAAGAGYKCLVIDSASAEWQELLTEKEALDARGGNSFANWGSISKKHEDFLKAVRNAPIHLILCLRAKQDHVQDRDASGRTTVRKVGLASIQREGMEYELTTVFDLAMDHNAKTSKDRTRLFDGRLEPLSENTGREFAEWLRSGKPLEENTGEKYTAPVVDAPEAKIEAPKPVPAPVVTPEEPSEEFEKAMIRLSDVLRASSMSSKEQAKIVNHWYTRIHDLDGLLEAISKYASTPSAVIQSATVEKVNLKPEVSQTASDFVDGMADGPAPVQKLEKKAVEPMPTLTPFEVGQIESRLLKHRINREDFIGYLASKDRLKGTSNLGCLDHKTYEQFIGILDTPERLHGFITSAHIRIEPATSQAA